MSAKGGKLTLSVPTDQPSFVESRAGAEAHTGAALSLFVRGVRGAVAAS